MTASTTRNKFSTGVCSLYTVNNLQFIIPSYQRPYVWTQEQVLELLDDCWASFEKRESTYFIGTVMTSVVAEKEELIDGQQRFTTLWLIALAFKSSGIQSELAQFLNIGEQLRFDFEIREKLKSYLTLLLSDKALALQKFSTREIKNDDYLINIANAISTIEGWLPTKQTDVLAAFGNYLYNEVKFVKNTAPVKTDLNKLFTTINNSGVQLEQTDILKANLLKFITTDKEKYSKIWEACENMQNFFEKNVLKLFPLTDRVLVNTDTFSEFNDDIFRFKPFEAVTENGSDNNAVILLANILNDDSNHDGLNTNIGNKTDYLAEKESEDVVYCESIISFGQLILHAYRSFLFKNNSPDFELPFHVKNLLTIFKTFDKDSGKRDNIYLEEHIKEFFRHLWAVRFVFDKYVVKWLSEPGEKEKMLSLTNLYKDSRNYFPRSPSKEKNDLSTTMLQSVLYHTTNHNTQIWLSCFLKRMLDGEEPLPCLEHIDNNLSLSLLEDKATTYILMDRSMPPSNKQDFESYLKEHLGTSFKHYWFQKLEYVLWKHWENRKDARFEKYRIVSKNSIEHISPQNPEIGEKLEDNVLDSFGNLALLNVSQNSSYSNQLYLKKKISFREKKDDAYDSLKLFYVYMREDEQWSKDHIKAHEEQMINKLKEHYQ